MTPSAKALDMPKSRHSKETALAAETTGRKPVVREQKGVFPAHIAPGGGWLSGLAHEQIHALATHVLAQHTDNGLRTLAITSALAGEGKTTLSLALSEKLASSGKRLLVIDLDTHRATLSGEAGLYGVAGAMESSDQESVDSTFHAYATDRPNVFKSVGMSWEDLVIAAGAAHP